MKKKLVFLLLLFGNYSYCQLLNTEEYIKSHYNVTVKYDKQLKYLLEENPKKHCSTEYFINKEGICFLICINPSSNISTLAYIDTFNEDYNKIGEAEWISSKEGQDTYGRSYVIHIKLVSTLNGESWFELKPIYKKR